MLRVKMFDEEHDKDLEFRINEFLEKKEYVSIIDIKYQLHALYDNKEQIFFYSAMIIYDSE